MARKTVRTLVSTASVAAVAVAVMGGQAGTAAADDEAAENRSTAQTAFTANQPGQGFSMPDLPPTPRGPSCSGGPTDPCGIIYNRTGHTLQLARDSSSHWSCYKPKHFRNLPSGKNSNTYGSPDWPDVDCFRDKTSWIFTNGRWYRPGDWIRTWTVKWVY